MVKRTRTMSACMMVVLSASIASAQRKKKID
jgi:hypothetical protein